MKNLQTPRLLHHSTLTGIDYQPESKPRPLLFALGLALGVFIGMLI